MHAPGALAGHLRRHGLCRPLPAHRQARCVPLPSIVLLWPCVGLAKFCRRARRSRRRRARSSPTPLPSSSARDEKHLRPQSLRSALPRASFNDLSLASGRRGGPRPAATRDEDDPTLIFSLRRFPLPLLPSTVPRALPLRRPLRSRRDLSLILVSFCTRPRSDPQSADETPLSPALASLPRRRTDLAGAKTAQSAFGWFTIGFGVVGGAAKCVLLLAVPRVEGTRLRQPSLSLTLTPPVPAPSPSRAPACTATRSGPRRSR